MTDDVKDPVDDQPPAGVDRSEPVETDTAEPVTVDTAEPVEIGAPVAADEPVDVDRELRRLSRRGFITAGIAAAAGLGDDAYGASIRDEIEAATGRKCSVGALYTTMDRLEKKGLLKTWMGEATPERGGRAKRMVRVTPKGVQAARAFYDVIMSVSRGVSWVAN